MKKIIGIAISVLMATLFCVTAFAVEPRWKNVIAISPTISAESQSYSSYIVADPKATKMECTLVLYEKGLDRLGLMDTVWSIILPGAVSTFPVFIMKKGFDGIPVSVLEAAELDGAGAITTYIRIGLPLGIPGILSALLLSFIEAWNAIEQPLVFLKSQNLWPMSLFLANITQDDIGIAMVASVFMLLPVILIFLFGQRYLILGIQSSGVKE